MRVDDWAALTERLEAHMAGVRRIFNDLIGDDEVNRRTMRSPSTGANCGRTRFRKMTPRRCWRT